jgi:pre-mRNA-processing factor 40
MNGMSGQFPPPGGATWTEHRTPDGRVYYYNAMTKVTQWTKPEDIMTLAEVNRAPYFCACQKQDLVTD